MKVTVTIDLTIPALKKHWEQMRGAARFLNHAKTSVRVSQPPGNPKRLVVSFSVPKARQADVVDGIAHQFRHWMEDYGTSTQKQQLTQRHQEADAKGREMGR